VWPTDSLNRRFGPHWRRLMFVVGLAAVASCAVQISTHEHRTGGLALSGTEDAYVYSTEAAAVTEYWLANAGNPAVRTLLQDVTHAPGWSGAASVSPDGRALAYTRLPRGESDPDTSAELWSVRLDEHRPSRLATGIDLRSALVWSPDASSVTFGRISSGRAQLWRQALDGEPAALVVDPSDGSVTIPVGYEENGRGLLATRYEAGGTDLVRIPQPGSLEPVAHLSKGTARGITLLPGSNILAFLAPDGADREPTLRGVIFDLGSNSPRQLPDTWGEIVGVAWQSDGRLSAGSAGPVKAVRDETGDVVLRAPASGFLQPLSWSPSGHFLAAREFSGERAAIPGTARDVLLRSGATVGAVSAGHAARFVAWVGPFRERRNA
jgi:dipeptidyl aminopeptidase/acylaminoacyl peptidase